MTTTELLTAAAEAWKARDFTTCLKHCEEYERLRGKAFDAVGNADDQRIELMIVKIEDWISDAKDKLED